MSKSSDDLKLNYKNKMIDSVYAKGSEGISMCISK